MRAQRFVFALLILACGFLAGLVLTGRMRATTTEAAAPSASADNRASVRRCRHSCPFLRRSPTFSSVATRTVPAVANISSTQVIARRNSPFANDPFFRYFFGDDPELYGSPMSSAVSAQA
jgi:S1-C subfamily serine protease